MMELGKVNLNCILQEINLVGHNSENPIAAVLCDLQNQVFKVPLDASEGAADILVNCLPIHV